MEKYKLQYKSHIQFKNLISHEEFTKVIKPIEDEIYDLEKANKFRQTTESKELRKIIKSYGEYFTTQSPLYFAITTNKIQLPVSQGKEHFCLITKIN